MERLHAAPELRRRNYGYPCISNVFPGSELIACTNFRKLTNGQGVSQSQSQHIQTACGETSTLQTFTLWPVVGEWTPAMTDCAKYLNGRGVGARYDGTYPGSSFVGSCSGMTGSASTFSSGFKTFLRQMWEAQVIAFERGGQGWLMWTWKTESTDEWSYQAGLANGWIPQNPTDYRFPTICG